MTVTAPNPHLHDPILDQAAAVAQQAIGLYIDAKQAWLSNLAELTTLQAQRADRKMQAVVRLTATTHPGGAKPFSISQAEAETQLDGEYAAYKERVAATELRVKETEYIARGAELVAELRIAEFRALTSLRPTP